MAAPDDATRIISELHSKLSELDSKVAAYRQDMVDEYERFSAALLQNAPQDVSDAVSRVMAESMSKHSSLYPSQQPDTLDSPDADADENHHGRRRPWDGRKSPPPILYHTSGVPKDAAARNHHPHDREHASFHGLFSPSYLPLLDGSDRPLHSPPLSPPPQPQQQQQQLAASTSASASQPASSPFDDDDDDNEKIAESAQPQPQSPPPPPPADDAPRFVRPPPLVRRPTDASSVDSSGSESKLRRSALRRSSSASTRASPRRVRFEVQGEEVLPTASPPQVSEADLPQLASDALPPAARHESEEESAPGRLLAADDADDKRDWPPARKVSSSERLRALSKLPLEDPSMWTVVNPQANNHDESAIMDDDDVASSSKANSVTAPIITASEKPATTTTTAAAAALLLPVRPAVTIPEPGRPLQDLAKHHNDDDDENESSDDEDDFIAMRPSKKSPISPRPSSSLAPAQEATTTAEKTSPATAASVAAQTATSSQEKEGMPRPVPVNGSTAPMDASAPGNANSQGAEGSSEMEEEAEAGSDADDDEEEEDELFEFDDETGGYPLTRASKLKPKRERHRPKEVEEPEDEALDPISDDGAVKAPGVSITKRVSPPLASPPVSASVGSYRGRSITVFDVVKDPRMHEKAAELGEFNSFIGSIDGRSGFDGADPTSFRASMNNVQYSGTPRSFSERMAMEQAQELRRAAERR